MLAIAGLNLSMVSLIGGFCKYYVDAKIGGLNSKIDQIATDVNYSCSV